MTAEVTPDRTPTVDEVRGSVSRAKKGLALAAGEVLWQVEHQVWTVLGYESWDDMREAEYGGVAVMVPSKDRPQLTAALRGNGLTQQSIAATLGVTKMTVLRDLKVTNVTPEDEPDEERRDPLTVEAGRAAKALDKAVLRVQRVAADDRFYNSRGRMAEHLTAPLANAVDVCSHLLDRIPTPPRRST